jgi:hypothetical protein
MIGHENKLAVIAAFSQFYKIMPHENKNR